MQTIEESIKIIGSKFEQADPAFLESFRELLNEPKVMHYIIAINDSVGTGTCFKIQQAMCLGILIGIESQREKY